MQLARPRGGNVVGLSPNIRIYRYSPSQFFDAHCTLSSGVDAALSLCHVSGVNFPLQNALPLPPRHSSLSDSYTTPWSIVSSTPSISPGMPRRDHRFLNYTAWRRSKAVVPSEKENRQRPKALITPVSRATCISNKRAMVSDTLFPSLRTECAYVRSRAGP